jgi:hypothetical protein
VIGGGTVLRLSWSALDTTAVLQVSETLEAPSWTDITTGISIVGDEFVYDLPFGEGQPIRHFYKLIRP